MKELVDWSNQSVIEEKHQPVWENRAEYWLVLFLRTMTTILPTAKLSISLKFTKSNLRR
jgi:hypothetical protein